MILRWIDRKPSAPRFTIRLVYITFVKVGKEGRSVDRYYPAKPSITNGTAEPFSAAALHTAVVDAVRSRTKVTVNRHSVPIGHPARNRMRPPD
jgi:hypothetical protein